VTMKLYQPVLFVGLGSTGCSMLPRQQPRPASPIVSMTACEPVPSTAREDLNVVRRHLGVSLRKWREQRLTQRLAAEALGFSLSKVMRIESGTHAVSMTDLHALLTLYQVPRREADKLLESGRRPSRFLDYAWVASQMNNASQVEEWCRLRLERQIMLERRERTLLNCVLDEAHLSRWVADSATMSEQPIYLQGTAGSTISISIISCFKVPCPATHLKGLVAHCRTTPTSVASAHAVERAERLSEERGIRMVNHLTIPVDVERYSAPGRDDGFRQSWQKMLHEPPYKAFGREDCGACWLIVKGSGLSAADGFDPRPTDWYGRYTSATAQLKASGLLTDLAACKVPLSGLGDTAVCEPSFRWSQQAMQAVRWIVVDRNAEAARCSTDESTCPKLPQHLLTAVHGYASCGSSAAYNMALSCDRALAPPARLAILGLPSDHLNEVLRLYVVGSFTSGKSIQASVFDAQRYRSQQITAKKETAHGYHLRFGRTSQRYQDRRTTHWWHVGTSYGQSDSTLRTRPGTRDTANRRLEDRHHKSGNPDLRLPGACHRKWRIGLHPGVGRFGTGTAEVLLTATLGKLNGTHRVYPLCLPGTFPSNGGVRAH
jgi:transcriptional regulator with XRE-family HTH domain